MPKFLRGARKSPRHKLLAAIPHRPLVAPPPQFAVVPTRLDMWGNDTYGDCVSAEEAFAKAWWSTYCGLSETFATAAEVEAFAGKYGYLDGADLTSVMDTMTANGMSISGTIYKDGGHSGVDYSNEMILQSALTVGPVKIAIDANALPSGAGSSNGWFSTSGGTFPNTDHCVALCGYGPAGWLYQQLGLPLPSGLSAATAGYLLFTWGTIGFVTHAWIMSTTTEAWVRNPTTVGQSPAPPNPPMPPAPIPDPGPNTVSQHLQLSLQLTPPHALVGTYTLTNAAADVPHVVAGPKVGLSLRSLWAFFVKYEHLLAPYVAEYWPIIVQTVLANLDKSYPEILAAVAEALIAAGAPAPAVA